jgi:hypothetical protein
MPLSTDLLELSRQMLPTTGDPLIDARARRVISTAYYAVFHLIAESVSEQISESEALKARIQRTILHSEVKAVCGALAKGAWPKILVGVLEMVPKEAEQFGQYFVELQAERHGADYDVSTRQTIHSASHAVISASVAFDLWSNIRGTPAGEAIAVAFVLARQFKN